MGSSSLTTRESQSRLLDDEWHSLLQLVIDLGTASSAVMIPGR